MSIARQYTTLNKLQTFTTHLEWAGMGFVAEEVKRARLAAGLSQEKLAAAIGISAPNYNKYETGKRRFTEAILRKIATAPGVNLDLQLLEDLDLMDREGTEKVIRAAQKAIEYLDQFPEEQVKSKLAAKKAKRGEPDA